MVVNEENFLDFCEGQRIRLMTLRNAKGMEAQVTNYGAKLVSLLAPDKDGNMADVVLGFNTLEQWQQKETYFNAIIGRVANRIKNGQFTLDGTNYQLAINNGTNHLHGGLHGFNCRTWEVVGQTKHSVSMHLLSRHGEENYPGNLDVYVTYNLSNDNALEIIYEAKTDRPTIIALTNHSYFNLKGEGNGNIKDHTLQVLADEYTPFDSTACPTGEVLSVKGTPMDFREPVLLSERIDLPFFVPGKGIDNNWILRKESADNKQAQLAAVLSVGARTMQVFTTMPGLQVYTGNYVEQNIGKQGKPYDVQTAICLEAQGLPNAINCPNFPQPILREGEIYFEKCIYKFV